MDNKICYNGAHMDQIDQIPELPNVKNIGLIAGGISLLLILLIILQHNLSFQKTSQTIIPAGNTYLGPPKTEIPAPTTAPVVAVVSTPDTTPLPTEKSVPIKGSAVTMNSAGKLTVGKDATWSTQKGKKYPYSFKAPSTLKLTTFPNDSYDIYAIAWENRPPDQNVLIGVDDLSRTDALKQYITLSKRSYVETWWKQFGGLKGVASIVEFTNNMGLKGYRAKFLSSNNQTLNEDVFFETPDTKYVIHMASGILDTAFFNEVIDSVAWGAK